MSINNPFALNHILAPNLNIHDFFKLAKNLNIQNIEIRNDLPKISLYNINAKIIKELVNNYNVNILSINALQKFNIWNKERKEELISLSEFAKKCDCKGIVLVPLNTGEFINKVERIKLLYNSLKNITPILNDYGLLGYIEPLGFEISSLRLKSEVAEAIDQISTKSNLKILHDTFHHYLANEEAVFPNLTGLVHISGISDTRIKNNEMKDDHRELINNNDVLQNVEQIMNLKESGYNGVFSFEPFSKKIQNINNPYNAVLKSISYLNNACSLNLNV